MIAWTALLTNLPRDKMAAILADDIFKRIFLNEHDKIPLQISMKLVPTSPIDNKPTLVQAMAWCRTGDKPLPWIKCWSRSLTRGRWVCCETILKMELMITSLGQNEHYFADDIFKRIFMNEKLCTYASLFDFHWSLFLMVQLTTSRRWFR